MAKTDIQNIITRAAVELGAWTHVILNTDKNPPLTVQALARSCVWQQAQIEALQRTVSEMSRHSHLNGYTLKEDASDLRIPDCGSEAEDPDEEEDEAAYVDSMVQAELATQTPTVNVNVCRGVLTVWVEGPQGPQGHLFSLPAPVACFDGTMNEAEPIAIPSTSTEPGVDLANTRLTQEAAYLSEHAVAVGSLIEEGKDIPWE